MTRRFICKIALLAPVPLCVVLVNVLVDPAGVFASREKREIAQHIARGYAVVAEGDMDSRQVLRYYVQEISEAPEVLALGSSRTMTLSSEFFPGQRFFNGSVPAATLRDIVANYQLFYEKALKPRRVLIGVDPHFLNTHADNRLYLAAEYRRAMQRLGLASFSLTGWCYDWLDPRYLQIISPAYFQVSLYALPVLLTKGRPRATFILDEATPRKLLRPDGSLRYELRRRVRDLDDVERRARRYVLQHPPELLHFNNIHDDMRRVFEAFVTSLHDDGIEVIFFLAPYHPSVYDALVNERGFVILPMVEQYLRDFAEASGIPVYGSYDADACGLGAEDFYDAVHATPESIRTLFPDRPDGT